MKFVVVSGGVLSGLGKGVTAASIGLLLKSQGIKTTAMKCDMYLNIDAGTMNPIEHGEVFVTHDGLETDQDLGHYERFMDINMHKSNYLTNGQIYKYVLDKERALEYKGVCVEPYHHIPPEIIGRWEAAGKASNADVVVVELGGTVGEYEGLLFFEAVRRLKIERPDDVCLLHVGYLPAPNSIGELKSKPMQQSVGVLNSLGLLPDFIIARAGKSVDIKRKEKIAHVSSLKMENIISNPDLESVYEIPFVLQDQKLAEKVIRKLKLKKKKKDLKKWRAMVKETKKANKKVNIAMVGKYQKTGDYTLEDSYVCVVEALKHAGVSFGLSPNLVWINSEDLESASDKKVAEKFEGIDAIVVPQGWGSRGVEGKINAAKYARENNVPYLGLCFGMQMATIEFGRNVVGLKGANTYEANKNTKYPVIHVIEEQKELLRKKRYGGTIRLGAWPCVIKKGTKLAEAYETYGKEKKAPWHKPNPEQTTKSYKNKLIVHERHRHRYEFNNKFKKRYLDKGFVISGLSPDGSLVEAIEIKNHPFFVATQFHPEYLSRPLRPHPIFMALMKTISS